MTIAMHSGQGRVAESVEGLTETPPVDACPDPYHDTQREGRVAEFPALRSGGLLVTALERGAGDASVLDELTAEIREASRARDAAELRGIMLQLRGVSLRMSNRLDSAQVMACVGIINSLVLRAEGWE
jgi:hypothetical protein